jgi:hypothetical protein
MPVSEFSLIWYCAGREESPETERDGDRGESQSQEHPQRLPAIEQEDAGEKYPANRDGLRQEGQAE